MKLDVDILRYLSKDDFRVLTAVEMGMLNSDEDDCKDGGVDHNGRPSFSSISKAAGSLDKELAASGFTKKDQDILERFVEAGSGDPESSEERTDDSGADGEPEDHQRKFDELNESDFRKLDSHSLIEQGHDVQENLQASLSGPSSEAEVQDASGQEGRNDEDDPELMKRLSKQRQSAIASACGRRRTITSRNSYKDKGGKSSHNSDSEAVRWVVENHVVQWQPLHSPRTLTVNLYEDPTS